MSENPFDNNQRGHVMFMHNQDVNVQNAGFYALGRSDKRNPSNEPMFDDHGMNEMTLRVFKITKLDKVITIYDSCQQAIAAMQA